MNILAAWDWHRITRFDVWSVLFWVNVVAILAIVIALFRHKDTLNPDAFTNLKW